MNRDYQSQIEHEDGVSMLFVGWTLGLAVAIVAILVAL